MAEDTNDVPMDEPQTDEQMYEAPEEAQEDNLPDYEVAIEDAGVLKKKVTVTIPVERIDAKRNEMFGELEGSAAVPGFRPGHAPRRLIEKRFGREITNDVRNAMVGAALGKVLERDDLSIIGEPDLNLDDIELPESGPMEFSFEIEVRPDFELPDLESIEVTEQDTQPADERLDAVLENFRQQRARHEETDEPVAEGDTILGSARISPEGCEPIERPGLTLRAAPGQVEGIPLVDLGKELSGKKAGDSLSLSVTISDAHANEEWRGKQATIEIQISSVRKTILPEMNDELAEAMGFDNLEELREYARGRLAAQVATEAEQARRDEVCKYLLDNTELEVPEGAAARHTMDTLKRRYLQYLRMGIPREQVDEHIAELQAAATEEARRDLKLQFILGKIAEQRELSVSDAEINSQVAAMAAQYGRRPERLRQELESDGTIDQLHQSILEQKVLDELVEKAKVVPGDSKESAGE